MNLHESQILALELMSQHGLISKGWSFTFDNAKRRFGYCQYKPKQISLSKHLTELNDLGQVKDTILHEIAHALAGPKAHHYNKWKYYAVQVGANPTMCYDETVVQPTHKWIGTCPNGHTIERMKRMRLSCNGCSPRFSTDFLFVWTPNNAV